MFNPESLPESFRERLRARRVIPFVGSGISRSSVGNKMWADVLTELLKQSQTLQNLSEEDRNGLLKARGPTVFAELLQQDIPNIAEATRTVLIPEGVKPNRAHKLMVRGPWPAIITTNWDSLLEAAWANLGSEHKQHRGELRRFYRRSAGDFLAQMKAGVRPLLFKFHGDFEEKGGRDEFVFTHRQYRALSLNERGTQNLLNLLCCDYSLLFYGHSLTDPDLLGFLDASHEGLGTAIGPHYWVTPTTDVPGPLRKFLRQHHNVEVIGLDHAKDFEECLAAIVGEGWQSGNGSGQPRIIPSLHYAVGPCNVELTTSAFPPYELLAEGEAVALSVARVDSYAPHPGRAAQEWLKSVPEWRSARSRSSEGITEGFEALDETARWSKAWLVSGQEVNGYGRTDIVHGVTRRFLVAARSRGVSHVHMSLLAAGGGGLPSAESLAAILHGLAGVEAAHLPTKITLHVQPDAEEFSPLADILDGLLDAEEILRRGRRGQVGLTVIHPDPAGMPGTQCSRVFLPVAAKGADLLDALGLSRALQWEMSLRRPMDAFPTRHGHRFLVEESLFSQQLTDSVLVELREIVAIDGAARGSQAGSTLPAR